MCPSVTYTPCATSLRGETGNIITFTQFEERNSPSKINLPYETRNDAESGDKSYDNSIILPLLREEEMDAMDYGDESDHDPISTEILKYYNAACTVGMALAHFWMLIHELLNKDPDIVSEESPIIVLYSKSFFYV